MELLGCEGSADTEEFHLYTEDGGGGGGSAETNSFETLIKWLILGGEFAQAIELIISHYPELSNYFNRLNEDLQKKYSKEKIFLKSLIK